MKKPSCLFSMLKAPVSILIIAIAFSGCQGYNSRTGGGEEEVTCFPQHLTMPSTISATCGNLVTLDAGPVMENPGSGYTLYKWNGPQGFNSTSKNPTFTASQFNAGQYSVTVSFGGGCESISATTNLVVTGAQPPCTANNNTISMDLYSAVNLTNIVFKVSSSSSKYQINTSGSGGSMNLEFSSADKPLPGTYKIVDSPYYQGEVSISVSQGSYSWHPVLNGTGTQPLIYVNSVNGKLEVVYCGISFYTYSSWNNNKPVGSGKVTEP